MIEMADSRTACEKMRDFYNHKPGARIVQEEFGFYSLDRWKREGYITDSTDLRMLFGLDPEVKRHIGQLGWCEAPFSPCFESKVLEDRGECELVQDFAGRGVLYFKGRRHGFMPEYLIHPVVDRTSWERDVCWRLDPRSPERYTDLESRMVMRRREADDGYVMIQDLIGGYMYLRSLIGPEGLLYMFYDDPGLIHSCMETWLALADAVTAAHQRYVAFDEVFFCEDICYNNGALISPDMMRKFLFPYYQQLLTNIRKRQKDGRKLHIQVDTDGYCIDVIPLYREIGMDYMSPFEVASGCDVTEVRLQYPDLLLRGGFDKRILAAGKDAIDREIDRIMPFMIERGGYIPTCDHGVPEEVSFENYMYYRERMSTF